MIKKLLLCLAICLIPLAALAEDSIPSLDKAGLANLLRQNKGKVIMLNFFATWCPPCRVELPELVKLRDAYPEKELLLLGLSVDEDKSAVPSFVNMAGVNYPVYMAARDITDEYQVTSVPHNAFYGRDGKLVISEPGMAAADLLEKVVDDLLKQN